MKLNFKFKATSIIIIAFLIIFSTAALASYIHNVLLNSYVATAADEFYFTSDLLTENEQIPSYQITHDWQANQQAAINFELKNYENGLNISNREIKYNVKALPGGSSSSGTIPAGGASGNKKTINLTVPKPANPLMPLEVTVTAEATSPYSKKLQAKFIITPAISYHMEANAGKPVAALTITLAQSTALTKNVIITWPADAAPDMTNPMVIGASNINLVNRTLTTALNTAAIYELVFFKNSSVNNYTGVTVTGN